jgi:serine/threonine protein kinase
MPTLEAVGTISQTLAQRLAKGRIPVPEALRYSMLLAEALRKIHESGQAHGAVSPSCIALNRAGLDLLPALGSMGFVTPYTAPEVVQGKPADSRSDIFSFGAILYEMLTGRAPFQADSPAALAAAIMNSAPPPSGSPAVDRLVASCIAKDPAARWQRVQKLLLELKLLSVAVRRSETPSAPRPQADPAIRAEMQQIELRLTGRLAKCEQSLDAVNERLARMEQLLQTTVDRSGRLETAADTVRQESATLRDSVSEDLGLFERSLKSQAATIESVRTAMAQTDDLVERVVEALESLQSVVLDHSDERALALS